MDGEIVSALLRFLLALALMWGSLQIGFWWGQAAESQACKRWCTQVMNGGE